MQKYLGASLKGALLIAVLGASSATSYGAIACADATLATIIAGGGCFLGDKLFTNLAFSGSSEFDNSTVTTTFNAISPTEYKLTLLPGALGTAGGVFTSTFNFSFDIGVITSGVQGTPCPTCQIIGVKDQANYSIQFPGGLVTDTKSILNSSGIVIGPLLTYNLSSPGNETQGPTTFPGVAGVRSSSTFTPTGGARLNSLEFSFAQATSPTVPEPMSLALTGLGLVGLGLIGRRRRLHRK